MKIWEFACTESAYAACQCNENIKSGDILVIESERCVAIADTWPIAVTVDGNGMHDIEDNSFEGISAYANECGWPVTSVEAAFNIAFCKGYVVTDPHYAAVIS